MKTALLTGPRRDQRPNFATLRCLLTWQHTTCAREGESQRPAAPIRIADAHGYGKRFIVRADEKLSAFLELESAIRSEI